MFGTVFRLFFGNTLTSKDICVVMFYFLVPFSHWFCW